MQNRAQQDIWRIAGFKFFSMELIWCTHIVFSAEDMCFAEYNFGQNKEQLSLCYFQNHSVFILYELGEYNQGKY